MQKAPNVPSASSKPAWRMLPEGSAALLIAQHQQQHRMIKLTVSHKVAPRKRDTCKDPKARLAPRSKKAGPAPRLGGQQPAQQHGLKSTKRGKPSVETRWLAWLQAPACKESQLGESCQNRSWLY